MQLNNYDQYFFIDNEAFNSLLHHKGMDVPSSEPVSDSTPASAILVHQACLVLSVHTIIPL